MFDHYLFYLFKNWLLRQGLITVGDSVQVQIHVRAVTSGGDGGKMYIT
jgi:hypothetical protein